jgi:hypothetical protein
VRSSLSLIKVRRRADPGLSSTGSCCRFCARSQRCMAQSQSSTLTRTSVSERSMDIRRLLQQLIPALRPLDTWNGAMYTGALTPQSQVVRPGNLKPVTEGLQLTFTPTDPRLFLLEGGD